jgi:hypothetical protein
VIEARAIFLSLLVDFAVLSWVLGDLSWGLDPDTRWTGAIVLVLSLYNFVALKRMSSLMLRDLERRGLARTYRRRSFVQSAIAVAPLALGFLGASFSGSRWIYLIGAERRKEDGSVDRA